MQIKEVHIIIGIILLAIMSVGIIYLLFNMNGKSKTLGASTGYYEISIANE